MGDISILGRTNQNPKPKLKAKVEIMLFGRVCLQVLFSSWEFWFWFQFPFSVQTKTKIDNSKDETQVFMIKLQFDKSKVSQSKSKHKSARQNYLHSKFGFCLGFFQICPQNWVLILKICVLWNFRQHVTCDLKIIYSKMAKNICIVRVSAGSAGWWSGEA